MAHTVFSDGINGGPAAFARRELAKERARREWIDLPADFESDAVHLLFIRLKGHMNKSAIKQRLAAGKAKTFTALAEALEISPFESLCYHCAASGYIPSEVFDDGSIRAGRDCAACKGVGVL